MIDSTLRGECMMDVRGEDDEINWAVCERKQCDD